MLTFTLQCRGFEMSSTEEAVAGDRTIFVCKQESLEVDNLFTQLSHCRSKGVILLGEDTPFCIQELGMLTFTLQCRGFEMSSTEEAVAG
jgi:hypothetical protein